MTQRAVPSSSSSSSFTYGWTYDVFLSFRGENTRYNFTGNLYNSLRQRGIHTFIDEEGLRRGEQLTQALHKAIEESRIAIIIFSENYACSTFCLEELVMILQRETRLVLPVFYGVDPSEVRHQMGSYGEALSKHQRKFKKDNEKVEKWKLALRDAANLSGWHFKQNGREYEHQFIERIVKEVSIRLNRTLLHIANHPVGLESQLLKINSLLKAGSEEEVSISGIYGIGGVGKTTIARAVYNLIADQFEGLCFLANVRERSKHGLVQLQEILLSELVREHDIKLGDVSRGIPILKHRLRKKKVLIILDDVDKIEQLQALAVGCDWFGPGSKIIITTRDKHLLDILGVRKIYEVKELNDDDSLDLLCWSAFKTNELDPSFLDISKSFVDYAKGLPLALEMTGSYLNGRTIDEWKSLLDSYRRVPNKRVGDILKVSYDGLEENEKEIFLDIACFFKWHELEYVMDIEQHVRGFNPSYGITVLKDKLLIKIENGHVGMHDLIQDMGREIVRQESPVEPGKRSRLWSHEDIVHVLENNTGTDIISVIIQDTSVEVMEVNWDGKAFKKMKNLKTLIIENACFSEGPKYLPNSLRILKWRRYPASCLPIDFHPTKLAILDLKDSCLESLEPIKKLENMSILNLSNCQHITQIPDISSIPNLKELLLSNCKNLLEVHNSVGYLRELKILRVDRCIQLRTFPSALKLPSLEHLGLYHCPSLDKFPKILEEMKHIGGLNLIGTNLELPFSIHNLTHLKVLLMSSCKRVHLPSSIAMLPKLSQINVCTCEEIQLSKQKEGEEEVSSMLSSNKDYESLCSLFLTHCNVSDENLSSLLTIFANVKDVTLSGSNFTILPESIKECHFLQKLDVNCCKNLREIRGIPPNIQVLEAENCTSLSSESTALLSQELHKPTLKSFCIPGERVPEWFNHYSRGSSTSFWFRHKLPQIFLCHIVPMDEEPFVDRYLGVTVTINGVETETTNEITYELGSPLLSDHIIVSNDLELNKVESVFRESEWNHVEVYSYRYVYKRGDYIARDLVAIKGIGIHVCNQESGMENIRFKSPYKRRKVTDFLAVLDFDNCNHSSCEIQHRSMEMRPLDDYTCWSFLSFLEGDILVSDHNLKFEIAKVVDRGRLVGWEGAERFVQLMQRHSHDREFDLGGRTKLLNVIAFSKQKYCLHFSRLIKVLPLLSKWLQDVHEGKFGDEESDKSVEKFLDASLGALQMLPVSLNEVRTSNVGKHVSRLCKHQSSRIQNQAINVCSTWVKHFKREGELLGANTGSSNDGNKSTEGSSVTDANNSHTTLSGEDTTPQLEVDSVDSDSSKVITGGSTGTEGKVLVTSMSHEELEVKRKEKLKEDDNLASMSNASSCTMDFGEGATDSTNSQLKQTEAETNHTQFPESRVTCENDKLTLNDNSLTWDPMEWEHQVACLSALFSSDLLLYSSSSSSWTAS